MATLADRIERRLYNITVHNPSVMALYRETLGSVLSRGLLRKIAEEAAAECNAAELESIDTQ